MALPRTQTRHLTISPGILHPEVGAGQFAPGICTLKLSQDNSPREFAPRSCPKTIRPGILHPKVGAGQIAPGFCTPKVGAGQFAPGICTPKLPQDKTTLNFVKPVNCSKELPRTQTRHLTIRPGILHPKVGAGQFAPGFCTPKVGAGQNVPEFCKAGRRLNKITGKTVKEQNHASHMLTEICLVLFGKKTHQTKTFAKM